jgi:hypothetical protein
MGTRLIALTLLAKLSAYAAITWGTYQLSPAVSWIVGGVLSWWFLTEEVEPWVVARVHQLEDEV